MLTKDDYQSALDSQSACNASGLIASLAKLTPEIWDEARSKNQGTDYVNTHPIIVLYLTQLINLAGFGCMPNDTIYNKAYDFCMEAVK